MNDTRPPPTSFRVGFNMLFMGERAGGMGRYVRHLLAALTRTPDCHPVAFVGTEAPADLFEEPWAKDVHWVRMPVSPRYSLLHRVMQVVIMPIMAKTMRLDVFHNPATFGPRRIPGIPVVTTLLELLAAKHPQTQWASDRVAARMADATIRAAREAERILTASHAAGDELSRELEIDPTRIDCAPLGITPPICTPTPVEELRRRFDLGDKRVVLCVAQKLPHKNLELLVQALPGLRDERIALILPGAHSRYESELMARAESLGVRDAICIPDWLTEEDLEGMYALADCLVLPSMMEGFGLPILEAMARGVPVACSDRWALPETAGDAALIFDPTSVDSVSDAIRQLLNDDDLRRRLIARGKARAEEFTWERCAIDTATCYRKAIAGYRSSRS